MLHLVWIHSIYLQVIFLFWETLFFIEIIAASSDGYAKLWNVKTGDLEREYAGHQKAVTALAFRDSPS